MRYLLLLICVLTLAAPTSATDLGNAPKDTKTNPHIAQNPGTPDGREGGEDMASAILIETLPFSDSGNTSDNIDDYEVSCPYGSDSPDVVYRHTPVTDILINVDLCGSSYDTKTYIMDGAMNVIACNDDAYFDDYCGVYVSLIEAAPLSGGMEYFIIIDGYGGDAGDYMLAMDSYIPPPPCFLTCDGLPEGEPPLNDSYYDAFNGGCNSPQFGEPFADLTTAADGNGELNFCGISGWFAGGRDTDWMHFMMGQSGMIEWTLDSEYPVYGFYLSGDCDAGITIEDQITAGPCQPDIMTVQGNPGDVVILWVGPTEFSPPGGFVGHEFNYTCDFTGLAPGIVPTSKYTFDAIKSLYR